MPVVYTIHPERKLVVATVTGDVTPEQMFEYQAALAADPLFSPTFDTITDFLAAAPFTGTPEDVRRLAQDGPFAAGVRRAFVVGSDLHFGLSRMAQALAEIRGVQIEIFRDREAASVWLGRHE